jgi:hypothetical protein
LSISISPTSGWKNVFGECLKISRAIAILTHHTNTDLLGILIKASDVYTGLIGLITCSIKFKLVNVTNSIG